MQKEIAVPRYVRPSTEWPKHRVKARKRRALRSKLAREAQQLIDKNTMKGVV